MTKQLFGWKGGENEQDYRDLQRMGETGGPLLTVDQVPWEVHAMYYQGNTDTSIENKRVALWESVIKLTGKHLANIPQELGDCVGASAEMGLEYLQADEIVHTGDLEMYRPCYRPWLYGAGRVYVGGNRLRGDGSLTTWQVKAMTDYGVLAEDTPGLPPYSTRVGREWGGSKAVLDRWKNKAADQIIQHFVWIENWDQACKAMIVGRMPLLIASSQGFRMSLKSDRQAGKSWFVPSGTWQHQMHVPAIDNSGNYPGIYIGNQWDESAHRGQLDGPDGGGWVSPEFFNRWLRQRNAVCVAIGKFQGWKYPRRRFTF